MILGPVAFRLSSPAFPNGGAIPARYTCDGPGVSPPLRWTAPPPRTRSLALLVTDLDAGGFVHWRATGIPPHAGGVRAGERLPHEGVNGFGGRGWGGPCPPGGTHRYLFVLSALDARGRTLATATLLGRYARR
jgi:Raf kinase inhibitor-like YbhB/YbcL family protein